jgi:hypothetical protein
MRNERIAMRVVGLALCDNLSRPMNIDRYGKRALSVEWHRGYVSDN